MTADDVQKKITKYTLKIRRIIMSFSLTSFVTRKAEEKIKKNQNLTRYANESLMVYQQKKKKFYKIITFRGCPEK